MHLVQLPSIYNTIQFISDISSLNVWTTLCLSHSVPGGLWKGLTRYHFPICMFFLSKQLFKAQLYILIDSEDVVIQVAVALWRRENKSTLLDKAERKGHVGRQLSRRSRNDPCPHFRSPTCGAGCLSILKQKALRLTLLFQGLHCGYVARECLWGEIHLTTTHGATKGLNNLYFPDRNLIFHGEKSKLTVPSTFVFFGNKVSRFW